MRVVAYTGLAVSLLGAAIDLASGYSLASTAGVGMSGPSILPAVAVLGLGAAVLIMGFLIVIPSMSGAMRRLGILMEVFGVIMALASARLPGMIEGLSIGMLIVGALMFLNGVLMQGRSDAPGTAQSGAK